MQTSARADFLISIAKSLVDAANKQNIQLRIFGGIGVRAHCEGIGAEVLKAREYRNWDLDLVADISRLLSVDRLLRASRLKLVTTGYHRGGEYRLYEWTDGQRNCTVDVYFVGQLRLNHAVPRPYFDNDNKYTLPITQLLLSKLAVVDFAEKDMIDVVSMLLEHPLGNSGDKETIQIDILQKVWCRGWDAWGTARTCGANIDAIRRFIHNGSALNRSLVTAVTLRLDELGSILIEPKSKMWRARRIFGAKIAWHTKVQPAEC